MEAGPGPGKGYAVRVVALVAALYALLMSAMSLSRAGQGRAGTYDLGIHDQAVWLVAQGLNPFMTSRGLQVQADHFSPIAYFLAPVYWLWDDARALLVLQSFWLAAGAFPVYLLARKYLRSRGLAQGLAVLYLCQPGLMFANQFDFHFSTLLFTPLLWACYALEARDSRVYYVALLTGLACSETAPFSLIGLLPLVWQRRGWRHALATLVLALSFLGFSHQWIRWHNLGQSTQYAQLYSEYGGQSGGVVGHLLRHPVDSLNKLNTELNRKYLLEIFAPVAFVPWLAPLEMVPATPVMLGNLLSWRESQHTIRYHYTAGILPFVMWATCLAWGRLERRMSVRKCSWLLVLACLIGLGVGPLHPEEWYPHEKHRRQALTDLRQLIPPEASISIDNTLGATLSHRQQAYLFPNPIQRAAWGNRPQALVDQSVMGLNPLSPGAVRRSLEQCTVDYIISEPGAPGDFPLLRPDRTYLLSEICAAPTYGPIYLKNGVAVFDRQKRYRVSPRVLPLPHWRPWWDHVFPF